MSIKEDEPESIRFRVQNMRDKQVINILENVETLKWLEGPNTKVIRQRRERIENLLAELHPEQYESETAAEIGRNLEFISDSFIDPKRQS